MAGGACILARRRLGSGAEEPVSVAGCPPTVAAPFDAASSAAVGARRPQEFFVRSSTGWKSALDRLHSRSSSAGSREEAVVRQLLTARRLHLEESAGFFLDDVQRVATHDYEPTDDDIRGAGAGQEWLMYDVGGTRSLRQAWAPFFDDINAIIFSSVPLSGGGVLPLLPGTPVPLSPAAGSPAGLAVPAHIQGMLSTTSLWSSNNSLTPSAPVNSATAPSGSGAASTTGLPPLPANVQVNPRIPELSAGKIPEVQEWMVPDRAYEARFRGMARCAKAELAAGPASMRARWWEIDVLVEAGVAARRRKEKFDLVHPHVPGSCEGDSKNVRSREKLKEAKRVEQLAPIHPIVTPEAFVQSVIDDYGLSSSYHATITKSIQKQLVSNDVSVAPTESTLEVARGSLQGPDTEWWASWRKHLHNKDNYVRTHALSQSVPEPQGRAEKRLKFASAEDAAKDTRASHDEDSSVDVEMTEVDEDKMYEEMRIIIKQFSYYFHRDAHIIREQGSTYQKSLFLVGHPSDGPAIQDDDLRMSFLPLVAPVARSVAQTQSCQPIVNCLSDGELDWLNKGGLVSAIPMTYYSFYFFSEKRVNVVASSCRIYTRIRILPSRACFPLITHHHPDDDTTLPSAHTVGACASVQGRTDKECSEEIDRQIKEDSLKLCKECNILLLGVFALVFNFISDPQLTVPRPAPAFPAYPRAPPGSVGSGKSTMVKRMKIIHQDWHMRHEPVLYHMAVYRNLLESVQVIMLAIRKLNVDPVLPTNCVYATLVLGYKFDGSGVGVAGRHSVRTSRVRSTLWADPIISRIMDRSTRSHDSGTRTTCPRGGRAARAHQKSIGFVETHFNIGEFSIHMFDVGSQHSECKKWIHVAPSQGACPRCSATLLEKLGNELGVTLAPREADARRAREEVREAAGAFLQLFPRDARGGISGMVNAVAPKANEARKVLSLNAKTKRVTVASYTPALATSSLSQACGAKLPTTEVPPPVQVPLPGRTALHHGSSLELLAQ
ncbi:hypothetical protein DFH11DRAFT_1882315 [Phellopilus nigrolimitatus]|nr:hypothetical protein DFH11DRAFT_1882315 [Phellopilus nigrolimitatus]